MYDFLLASYSNFVVIVRFLRERHIGCKSLFVVSQPCLPPFVRAIASEFRHCFAQKLKWWVYTTGWRYHILTIAYTTR